MTMKIVTSVNLDITLAPNKLVSKSIAEYINEDEKEVHKDGIHFETSCEGEQVRKNKM